jgi:cell division protein FtsQ
VVLASALGSFALSRTPLFDEHRVVVRGTRHLSVSRVVRESGVTGRNVLWLDAGAAERALERDPWIAHAEVSRVLPRGIAISIVEREPVAVVRRSDGYALLAGDGTVLATPPSSKGWPQIRPGTIPSAAQAAVLGSARSLAALPSTVRDEVRFASQDDAGEVSMRLRGGTVVRFGPPSDLPAKADALAAVLSYADGHGVRLASIDVRFPAAPSARVVGGGSIAP